MQPTADIEHSWNELRQSVDLLRKAINEAPSQLSNDKYSELYALALSVLRCLDPLDPKVPLTKRPSALHTLSGTPSSSIPNVLQPIDESGRRLSASFFDFGATFLGQRPLAAGDFFATRASFSVPPDQHPPPNPVEGSDPNIRIATTPVPTDVPGGVIPAMDAVKGSESMPAPGLPLQPPPPQTYVYRHHPMSYSFPIPGRPPMPVAPPGDILKSHIKPDAPPVMHSHHPHPTLHGEKSNKAKKRSTSEVSRKNLVCVRCKVTDTPEWRRGPEGILCNACGLRYMKSKKAKAREQQSS